VGRWLRRRRPTDPGRADASPASAVQKTEPGCTDVAETPDPEAG
jgi:hypothetical protein